MVATHDVSFITLKNYCNEKFSTFQLSLSSTLYDIAGGVTVGLTAVPQSLAYAQLAGLPIEVCIFPRRNLSTNYPKYSFSERTIHHHDKWIYLFSNGNSERC